MSVQSPVPMAPPAVPRMSRRDRALRRSPLRSPLAVIGFVIIIGWALIAIFAPLLAPANPLAQNFALLDPPSHAH